MRRTILSIRFTSRRRRRSQRLPQALRRLKASLRCVRGRQRARFALEQPAVSPDPVAGAFRSTRDHERAAVLALSHFKELKHERVAFMRGNPLSADAKDRWDAICRVAGKIGMKMDPDLIVQIDTDDPTPMLGYPFAKQLLAHPVSLPHSHQQSVRKFRGTPVLDDWLVPRGLHHR